MPGIDGRIEEMQRQRSEKQAREQAAAERTQRTHQDYLDLAWSHIGTRAGEIVASLERAQVPVLPIVEVVKQQKGLFRSSEEYCLRVTGQRGWVVQRLLLTTDARWQQVSVGGMLRPRAKNGPMPQFDRWQGKWPSGLGPVAVRVSPWPRGERYDWFLTMTSVSVVDGELVVHAKEGDGDGGWNPITYVWEQRVAEELLRMRER